MPPLLDKKYHAAPSDLKSVKSFGGKDVRFGLNQIKDKAKTRPLTAPSLELDLDSDDKVPIHIIFVEAKG